MRYKIIWTEDAIADLTYLSPELSYRISLKVAWIGAQSNPFYFAKKLTNAKVGTYRFRVGEYRVLFDVGSSGLISILHILRVKHRRDAYE